MNEGAFCAYELAVAAHEAKCWRDYLSSPRKFGDKKIYLDNKFSEILE